MGDGRIIFSWTVYRVAGPVVAKLALFGGGFYLDFNYSEACIVGEGGIV
jgi:hypothetical protein